MKVVTEQKRVRIVPSSDEDLSELQTTMGRIPAGIDQIVFDLTRLPEISEGMAEIISGARNDLPCSIVLIRDGIIPATLRDIAAFPTLTEAFGSG